MVEITTQEHKIPLEYLAPQHVSSKPTPFLLYYGRYCYVNVANSTVSYAGKEITNANKILEDVAGAGFEEVIYNVDSDEIMYDLTKKQMIKWTGFQWSPRKTGGESILCTDGVGHLYKVYAYGSTQAVIYAQNISERFEAYKATPVGKEILLLMISQIFDLEVNTSISYSVEHFDPKQTGKMYQIPDFNLTAFDKAMDKINRKYGKKGDELPKTKVDKLIKKGTIKLSEFLKLGELPYISSTIYINDDINKFPVGTYSVYFSGKKFWITYSTLTPPLSLLEYRDILKLDNKTPAYLLEANKEEDLGYLVG